MPKPLRVAGDVDSWCTRCRLVLNHRIVSMKSGKAHQVECLTCRTTHLWRPAAPVERAAPSASGDDGSAAPTRADRPRATRSASKAPRASQAMRHEQQWETAIAGRGVLEFKPYNVAASFREGDLVRHKKFGDGIVTRVIDAHKVEVLFRDEAKTLAQGMS
jgi:hypothetical protein